MCTLFVERARNILELSVLVRKTKSNELPNCFTHLKMELSCAEFVWNALLYLAVMELFSALAAGRLDWCPCVAALCDDWCVCLPGAATLTVIKHRAAINIRLLPLNQTLIKMGRETSSREENTAEKWRRGSNVACKKDYVDDDLARPTLLFQ